MKRKIIIALVLTLVLSIVTFIVSIYQKKRNDFVKYETMPKISYTTIYNQKQNINNLTTYKGYVIQLFNPDCEICMGEAQDYFEHKDLLQDYLFFILSTDSIYKVKEFAVKQQLSQTDNFIFGHIDRTIMHSGFGDVPIPSLFLYNSERKFITKTRITDSRTILKFFNEKKKH